MPLKRTLLFAEKTVIEKIISPYKKNSCANNSNIPMKEKNDAESI